MSEESLRSTLEAAVAAVEKPADAPAPAAPAPAAPAPAAPASSPATAPAEQNLYEEKQGDSDKTEGQESTTESNSEQNSLEKTQEKPDDQSKSEDRSERAPQSWKPAAKAKWASIDPDIRAEVLRRDREVTKALGDSANARKFATTFQEVVKPFEGRLRSANVHPLQAFRSLMHLDQVMSSGSVEDKARYAAKWLMDYQVDIAALEAALNGGDPATAPQANIERIIEQRLAPVSEFINEQRSSRQREIEQDQQRAAQVVSDMESDTSKYPYFDLVREEMADIIEISAKRGVYLTPQQAYTRAVAMNPEAQEAQATASKQNQAHKANDEAQRAMGASLSVSGNPSLVKKTIDPNDLRGTIEAAAAAVSGR